MALLKYSINTRIEEICNMRRLITKERQKLDADIKEFERNEAEFEGSVNESEKALILAIIRAENQAKKRIEKTKEFGLLNAQYLQLKAEICRNDIKLHDYRCYQRFLESLVKMKGQKTGDGKIQSMTDLQKEAKSMDTSTKRSPDERQADVLGTVLKAVIKFQRRLQVKPPDTSPLEKPSVEDGECSSEESFNLNKCFKESSELMDLLKDLEISNLSLIQNCQDAEETIESLRRKEEMLKTESTTEVRDLVEKMNRLKAVVLKKDNEFMEEFGKEMGSKEIKTEEEQFEKLCEKIAYVNEKCSLQKGKKTEVTLVRPISAVSQFAQIEAHLDTLLTSVTAAESVSEVRVATLRHSVRVTRLNEFHRQQREAERRRQEGRNQRILLRAQAPPLPPEMILRAEGSRKHRGK
ncbi:coiled coil domain containing protein 37 [Echinococcus multilocularis]|uniref:Coiled coil domain containing protein 37 n=1 Tax=Echinococcus multilocularis TaxID=6211 RepID=A0A087VX05_ECHMU|nr:coiled coil domain containing protein 37 [Echinococcus multilocularis]